MKTDELELLPEGACRHCGSGPNDGHVGSCPVTACSGCGDWLPDGVQGPDVECPACAYERRCDDAADLAADGQLLEEGW